jgi:hypothetical protein
MPRLTLPLHWQNVGLTKDPTFVSSDFHFQEEGTIITTVQYTGSAWHVYQTKASNSNKMPRNDCKRCSVPDNAAGHAADKTSEFLQHPPYHTYLLTSHPVACHTFDIVKYVLDDFSFVKVSADTRKLNNSSTWTHFCRFLQSNSKLTFFKMKQANPDRSHLINTADVWSRAKDFRIYQCHQALSNRACLPRHNSMKGRHGTRCHIMGPRIFSVQKWRNPYPK